jgi:hypothetical protein
MAGHPMKPRFRSVVPLLSHVHTNPNGSTIVIRRLGEPFVTVQLGRRVMTLDFWKKVTA